MRITTKLIDHISAADCPLFISLGWNSYHHEQSLISNRPLTRHASLPVRSLKPATISPVPNGVRQNIISPWFPRWCDQIAARITEGSPYYVRQISLRNRNPENRPDPYETG
jgi:hypothetical protein